MGDYIKDDWEGPSKGAIIILVICWTIAMVGWVCLLVYWVGEYMT